MGLIIVPILFSILMIRMLGQSAPTTNTQMTKLRELAKRPGASEEQVGEREPHVVPEGKMQSCPCGGVNLHTKIGWGRPGGKQPDIKGTGSHGGQSVEYKPATCPCIKSQQLLKLN